VGIKWVPYPPDSKEAKRDKRFYNVIAPALVILVGVLYAAVFVWSILKALITGLVGG